MLPVGYTQLDYILARDRAIDTGYVVEPEMVIEAIVRYRGTDEQQRVFGTQEDGSGATVCIYNSSGDVWSYSSKNGSGSWTWSGVSSDFEIHKFFMDNYKRIIQIDDGTTYEADLSEYQLTNSSIKDLCFLATYSGDNLQNFLHGEFYGAKVWIWENDEKTLISEFVPAIRDADQVVGVYDTVSDTFNIGTGDGVFKAGPVTGSGKPDPRELRSAQYDIEVWDWKTNTFIADISAIVKDGLAMSWTLNDIETLDFTIDLIQFEKKCQQMGVAPSEVLTPYIHDIRVRRNGEYILGCQVVEANIRIDNNSSPSIEVRCTGFLNLFKDRYISEPLGGYTYSEIARLLVTRGQQADPIVKNPTGDIDTSYWLSANGTHRHYVGSRAHSGAGCIAGTRSGSGWITMGTQMWIGQAVPLHLEAWVSGQAGRAISVRERQYVNASGSQVTLGSVTPTSTDVMTKIELDFTTTFDKGYIIFEIERTNSSTELLVDDVWLTRQDDEDSLMDFNVKLGLDNASAFESRTRSMAYSLQNIKDALMDLTSMEDDNFDFDFSPDRTFNVYREKGGVRSELDLIYPGNIDSLTVSRSASNLANKIQNIGSGIGDERLEVWATDTASRELYGTRESVVTNNNVSSTSTLTAQAEGMLTLTKDLPNLPSIVVSDGSVNPGNVQTGDVVYVRAGTEGEYLSIVDDYFRVVKLDVSVSDTGQEQVSLGVEPYI